MLTTILGKAIDLSKQNCAYWYNHQAAVQLRHHIVQSAEIFEVYVQLYTVERRQDSLSFYLQNNYSSEDHKELQEGIDTLSSSDHLLVVKLLLPDTVNNLMIVEYRNQQSYYFPIQLKYTTAKHPSFYLSKEQETAPDFNRFVNEGTYHLQGVHNQDSVFVYRYQEQFTAADPPMQTSFGLSPQLQFDSVYVSSKKQIQFEEGFFYFIQLDSASDVGITRYVGDRYYPKLTRLDALIPPVRYIARKSEYEVFEINSNKKKTFDQFWLSLYPIKRNASDAIAAYYQSVSHANELFSSYKPGWKTDQGMIYMVMGVPDEVIREDWKEIWRYEGGITFEFRIISNLFALQQYYLTRSSELSDDWYRAVRTLRNNR